MLTQAADRKNELTLPQHAKRELGPTKLGFCENTEIGIYQPGLKQDREDVISAHFMHSMNQDKGLALYSPNDFMDKSIRIRPSELFENLIPSLLEASKKFINERVEAIKKRAQNNISLYELSSVNDIGLPELITEAMLDRQFLKGDKSNISRVNLCKKIRILCDMKKPIKMVIPALPYKSSSPLKTRGSLPGLAEVNFLLGLTEIAKVIDILYRETHPELKRTLAQFTVVCDGTRFNHFLNEPNESILEYQNYLSKWIEKLGISNFVEIIDYSELLKKRLSKTLLEEKNLIRKNVFREYKEIMSVILDPYDLRSSIQKAIELEPDPEKYSQEGRFIPLFKSLLYIVKYKTLNNITSLFKMSYSSLYRALTGHIFEPYCILSSQEIKEIALMAEDLTLLEKKFSQEKVFEYFRQCMLIEAWYAAIDYIAEIRSDRDLKTDPISSCFPEHVRWTIHAKPGQLAILTTTASGDPVQAWHGVAMLKPRKSKIKLYTLPVLSLEGMGATPVLFSDDGASSAFKEYAERNQPLFYIHPDLKFKNMDDFLEKIKEQLTRSRKS